MEIPGGLDQRGAVARLLRRREVVGSPHPCHALTPAGQLLRQAIGPVASALAEPPSRRAAELPSRRAAEQRRAASVCGHCVVCVPARRAYQPCRPSRSVAPAERNVSARAGLGGGGAPRAQQRSTPANRCEAASQARCSGPLKAAQPEAPAVGVAGMGLVMTRLQERGGLDSCVARLQRRRCAAAAGPRAAAASRRICRALAPALQHPSAAKCPCTLGYSTMPCVGAVRGARARPLPASAAPPVRRGWLQDQRCFPSARHTPLTTPRGASRLSPHNQPTDQPTNQPTDE